MSPMLNRIYIAGKWQEAELVRRYATELRILGYYITMPWFECHVGPGIENITWSAVEDERGVRQADTCIFIFERELAYSGAMSELGIALALGKRIIVVGSGGNKNIFTHHPLVEHVNTFEEAIACLNPQLVAK